MICDHRIPVIVLIFLPPVLVIFCVRGEWGMLNVSEDWTLIQLSHGRKAESAMS
jgi:hypothetical protein